MKKLIMKKLIIGMFAIATIMTASAKTTITIGTNEVDAIKYYTDWANCNSNIQFSIKENDFTNLDENLYAQIDDICAKNGNYNKSYLNGGYIKFPKLFENYKTWMNANQPGACDIIVKVWTLPVPYYRSAEYQNMTSSEKNRFNYSINHNYSFIVNNFLNESSKKSILTTAQRYAKKTLRKQGKSFVDKDGISPIKIYIDAIQNALNAPKYAGLEEALKTIGMDFGMNWKFNAKYADAEIIKIKEDILNGECKFDSNYQNILKAYLGIEEYNKFVKIYNEGE